MITVRLSCFDLKKDVNQMVCMAISVIGHVQPTVWAAYVTYNEGPVLNVYLGG